MSTQPIIHTTSIWSRGFWKGAGERALKTFCQSFLAVFGVGTAADVTGATLNTDTWILALVSGGAAAALSVIMSVANPAFTAGEHAVEPFSAPQPEAAYVPEGTGDHRLEDDAVVTETTIRLDGSENRRD